MNETYGPSEDIPTDRLGLRGLTKGLRGWHADERLEWMKRWWKMSGEAQIDIYMPSAGGIPYILKNANPSDPDGIEIETRRELFRAWKVASKSHGPERMEAATSGRNEKWKRFPFWFMSFAMRENWNCPVTWAGLQTQRTAGGAAENSDWNFALFKRIGYGGVAGGTRSNMT
jgi:hypothetical protein